MPQTNKQIKQRYFDKVYAAAPWITCSCGCGFRIKSKDRYGRDKSFISGHNGRKYDDPKQYKREWNHRNRERKYSSKVVWGKKKKAEFVNLLGGKCTNCGLAFDGKNHSVFDFHHLRDKSFNVSASIHKYSVDTLLEELEKCELLCANCHRLHHSLPNTADSSEGPTKAIDLDDGIVQAV